MRELREYMSFTVWADPGPARFWSGVLWMFWGVWLVLRWDQMVTSPNAIQPLLESYYAVWSAYLPMGVQVWGIAMATGGFLQAWSCQFAMGSGQRLYTSYVMTALVVFTCAVFIISSVNSTATPVYVSFSVTQFWLAWRERV